MALGQSPRNTEQGFAQKAKPACENRRKKPESHSSVLDDELSKSRIPSYPGRIDSRSATVLHSPSRWLSLPVCWRTVSVSLPRWQSLFRFGYGFVVLLAEALFDLHLLYRSLDYKV